MTTVGKKIWEAWKFFLIRAYNFFFFTTLLDGMEKKFIPYNLLGSQWFQWVDEAKIFWPHLKICFSTYDFSLVGWLRSQKKLRARSQKYILQAWIRFFLATFDQNFFWLIPCQKNLIQARPKKFRELACKFFGVAVRVKLAERSKAPDLSSGSHKRAWVRTPHLTNLLAGSVFKKGQLVMLWGALSIGLRWTPDEIQVLD